MKIATIYRPLLFCALLLSSSPLLAQFSLGGQFLQRPEIRNGFGQLIERDQEPSLQIGHRARVQVDYASEQVHFFLSIQDIRIWGNTPQVKVTDGFLSAHEAYGEIFFSEAFRLKLGRQELNYDNFRFLGNLDWALQARAHDFALAKYEKDSFKIHFGGGYNQEQDALINEPFLLQNQYKIAQMLRLEHWIGAFDYAFLFWNNGVQQYSQISSLLGEDRIRYSPTFGLPRLRYRMGNTEWSAFYYHQLGRDAMNRPIRAYDVSAQLSQLWPNLGGKAQSFKATLGFEWLSGTDQEATDGINRSFNPLYGTNHPHNGYMDFFYVGNRYLNSTGLQDYFLRLRWDPSPRLFLSMNSHLFYAAADILEGNNQLPAYLGTETDFTFGYIFNDVLSFQGGYSQIFASPSLAHLQNREDPAAYQSWAYLAILYRPNNPNRFFGLLF